MADCGGGSSIVPFDSSDRDGSPEAVLGDDDGSAALVGWL